MHLRDLVQFLAELSNNNNRAWFVMNKPRYNILRAEFLELVTDVIAGIAKFDPAVATCNPKKALFRINRDVRFSHDKSPYKTIFSAAITASGLKKPSQGGGPAYYFHIDDKGQFLIAGGEYMPPADRLRAIRLHIANDPKALGKLLKSKKLNETFGGLNEESKLTRPPKGFSADAPHIESIKLKSFIAWTEKDLKKKFFASLENELVSTFKDAYPLIEWLRQAR